MIEIESETNIEQFDILWRLEIFIMESALGDVEVTIRLQDNVPVITTSMTITLNKADVSLM